MEELIKTVTAWPIIIQGALGSALFSLIVYFGQKLFNKLLNFLASYSKTMKKTMLMRLKNKYIGFQAHLKNDTLKSNAIQTGLIYTSIRNIIKGFIWVLLGLILSNEIYIFSIIGYLGGLYYMFHALNIVQGIDTNIDVEKKLLEIDESLNNLKI